jgi:hypothetical protein
MPFHVVVTFIAMTLVTAVAPVGLVPVIVTVGAGVADGERADLAIKGAAGKRLTYRQLISLRRAGTTLAPYPSIVRQSAGLLYCSLIYASHWFI